MTQSVLLLLVSLVLLCSFLMLLQSRIINLVYLLILQNITITTYLLLKTCLYPSIELSISLLITFIIKVILLPWLLLTFVNALKLAHHNEALVNRSSLQFVGLLLVVFAILLSYKIEALIGQNLFVGFSLSLSNSFIAILLIIFRRKAISQVISLLVLENSIFLLSATLTRGFPWLVELGIGFDILIGFMIFVLFLLRIRTTHGSFNTHYLEKLKERV